MAILSSIAVVLLLVTNSLACGLLPRTVDDEVPQYAPIPASALGIKVNSDGYAVEAFGKGAYMVTDSNYQALFLVSTKGVIVVDAPPTIGHGLLWAIGNITHLPITHVVYSHMHADHIGGAFIFPKKAKIIAHVETARYLTFTPDKNRPIPEITFKESYTLRVGNQTLELDYKGENHLLGNLFIYAPKQKILMLVDIVYPGWTPFALLGQAKNVAGFIHSHDQILRYDFKHYIGGHLGRSGSRSDVLTQKEYVLDLKQNCIDAIELSATNDPVYGATALLGPISEKNPGNGWAGFKNYLDVMANLCANVTNEKWLGRLAAADVFQFENAGVMIESLRIDFGVLGPFATV